MTDRERIIQVFKDQIKLCGPDPEKDRWWVTMTADDSKMIVRWLSEKETVEPFHKCIGDTYGEEHPGWCPLKEQEAVKPVLDEQTGRIWLCGKCGSYVGFEDNDPHDPNEFDRFCRDCGTPVLWEGR